MIIVCIDPGASGAIAVRGETGAVSVHPLKGVVLSDILRSLTDDIDYESNARCYVEKNAGYIPGNSGNSAAKFAGGIEYIKGFFAGVQLPLIDVSTRKWASIVPGLSSWTGPDNYQKRKLLALRWAAQRYPRVSCTSPSGLVTKDCGDALCMLAWAEGQR